MSSMDSVPAGALETAGVADLDSLDFAIIAQLQEDGRRPYREIGRALNVSEGTIRVRLKRLTESRVVQVVAIADPFSVGYTVMAFMLIRVSPGSQQDVIAQLVDMHETTYVSSCAGHADIYIQVVCRDHNHLFDLVTSSIPGIGGVEGLETFTELKMHKLTYTYSPRSL